MSSKAEIAKVLITENETMRSAVQKLCACSKYVLFVVAKNNVLLAALSDGDIRRFLLRGGDLDASVKDVANYHPDFLFETEREGAEQFLWDNKLTGVPIVDEDMHIVDIVFLHDEVAIDEVKIRQLQREDLTMVMGFFDQMSGSTRAMFNRGEVNRIRVMEHLNRKAEDNQIHFAAVIKEPDGSDKMVGYTFLWDIDKKIPWLGVAVREDWKGHHLGRVLLEHLDTWAKPKGYGGLMLTSVPANVRAHALYTRMGYEYYGVYPDSEFLYVKRYEMN